MRTSAFVSRVSPALLVALLLWHPCAAQVEKHGKGKHSCSTCRDEETVLCPPCSGSGRIRIPCWACDRTGSRPCLQCNTEEAIRDPELKIAVRRMKKSSGRKKTRKGRLPCLNSYCRGGRMTWQGGATNPCRVCGGNGTIKCGFCSGGKATCKTCGGTRKRTAVCWDCAGGAKLACPGCKLEKPPEQCPHCKDKRVLSGADCKFEIHGNEFCSACSGKGKVTCRQCAGTNKTPCGPCAGCGKIRINVRYTDTGQQTKGGIRTCSSCKGKGHLDCMHCKRGRAPCARCKGRKKTLIPCHKSTRLTCACVTMGPHAPIEVLGDILLAAGLTDRAFLFFREAEARTQAELPAVRGASKKFLKEWKRQQTRARLRLATKTRKASKK